MEITEDRGSFALSMSPNDALKLAEQLIHSVNLVNEIGGITSFRLVPLTLKKANSEDHPSFLVCLIGS